MKRQFVISTVLIGICSAVLPSAWNAIQAGATTASGTQRVTYVQYGDGRAYQVQLPRSERWLNASSNIALTQAYKTTGDIFLVRSSGRLAPGHIGAYLDFGMINGGAIPTDTSLYQYQKETVLQQAGISDIKVETLSGGTSLLKDAKIRKHWLNNVSEVSYNATEQVSHAPVRVSDYLIAGERGWYT
ncbi:MAG: hypothetical protein ACRDYB_08370, partial [Acidimicrobiales bacterium]